MTLPTLLALAALALDPSTAQAGRQRSTRPATQPAKPASPADSLLAPTWVLTRDKPKAGQVVEALLVVPRYRVADTTASVIILPPSIAQVWLRTPGSSCTAREAEGQQSIRGVVARDTILLACVGLTDQGTLRLVAVRRALDSAGTGTVQRIAVSDPIVVAPWFTFSATMAAVLSFLGGILAGVLGHIARDAWDRRQKGRRSVEEMQAVVAKALVPELDESRRRLERWLPAGTGVAPDLLVAGYNQVLGDKGVAAYLDQGTRATYYRAIKSVYAAIEDYTRLKNTPGSRPEDVITAARHALDLIRKPLP